MIVVYDNGAGGWTPAGQLTRPDRSQPLLVIGGATAGDPNLVPGVVFNPGDRWLATFPNAADPGGGLNRITYGSGGAAGDLISGPWVTVDEDGNLFLSPVGGASISSDGFQLTLSGFAQAIS